jgi:hypothetical protein
MIKHVQQSEVSGPVKATSVADYIVDRLAAEGIDHCFGVAGDYVFPICDAVDSSAKVKWIGCANELNASYAADGYARIRGAAMLATTCSLGDRAACRHQYGVRRLGPDRDGAPCPRDRPPFGCPGPLSGKKAGRSREGVRTCGNSDRPLLPLWRSWLTIDQNDPPRVRQEAGKE